MKKRPVLLLIMVSFFIAINAYILFTNLSDLKSEHERISKKRADDLVSVLKSIPVTTDEPDIQRLAATYADALDRKIEYKVIDYYIIRHGHNLVTVKNVDNITEEQQDHLDHVNEVLFYEKTVFASVKRGDLTISVGYNRDWDQFKKQGMKLVLSNWVEDVVFVCSLLICLLVFFFKDILKIVKSFERRDRTSLDDVRPMSREADRLLKVIGGYEERLKNLETSQQTLEKQLYDGVKEEMRQGRKPPYRFECVMVRTDLSDFSAARKKSDPKLFELMIDEFFTALMTMVSRHGGYTAEFLGDELLFYFKTADHSHPTAQALCCLTDLNKIADEMSVKSEAELDFSLKLKSSLCTGEIEVREATRGIEFRGEPLIESVRILKEVTEKTRHIILYGENCLDEINPVGKSVFYKEAYLKGIGTLKLFELESRLTTESILENLNKEDLSLLSLIRSDEDFIKALNYLDKNRAMLLSDLILPVLSKLRLNLPRAINSPNVILAYKNYVSHLQQDYLLLKDSKSLHVLSAAVSLCALILDRGTFDSEFRGFLSEIATVGDPRVFANTIDVFVKMGESLPTNLAEGIQTSSNNRVIANSVILAGQKELAQGVLAKIGSMIASHDPYFIASGLYAMGELAQFYRLKDLVYLKANLNFERLLKSTVNFFDHENEMVRRQALMVARKSEDSLLVDAVRAFRVLCVQRKQPERIAEITKYFGGEGSNPSKSAS